MKQEFIRVGRIVNAHGIRGEVRVQPRRVSPGLLTRCKTFPQGAGAAEIPRRGRYERRPDL